MRDNKWQVLMMLEEINEPGRVIEAERAQILRVKGITGYYRQQKGIIWINVR